MTGSRPAAGGASPLRICVVVLDFAPKVGGAEARAEKQARALRALGHDVVVVTSRRHLDWPAREDRAGLPVRRFGGVYRRDGNLRVGRVGIWPVVLGVFGYLWGHRREYDLIHVFDYSPLAAAAALVAKLTRKPIVITFQNTGLFGVSPDDPSVFAHAAIGAPILDWCIRAARPTYQVLSSRGRRDLLARGFDPNRVVLISGSVDTEKFRPASDPDADSASVRTIACVARLDYAKGIDVLLHAWSEPVRASGDGKLDYRPRLVVIGDGRLRHELQDLARDLAITDTVEFAGERTDIAAILPSVWGFVLPSRREGMPNALLEAMACGLPCVATRVSGTEDIVTDGVDGLLVEPENPQELANALRCILNDPTMKLLLGTKARERVVREYSLSRVVDESVALYRGLTLRNPMQLVEAVGREGIGG